MFERHVLSLISAWLLGWWVIGQPAERSLLVPSAAQEEVILVMPFSAADSGGGDRLSQYLVAELNRSASALRPVPYDTAVERADILPVPDPNCITGRQLANILSYPAMVCGSLVRGAAATTRCMPAWSSCRRDKRS